MAERDDQESSPKEDRDIVRWHLTRAWQSWAPSPDLDARVRARLTSSSAATMGALGLGAATGAGRPSPWAALQATGKLGALVGAGLVGVGFLSGYAARASLSPSIEPRREPAAAVATAEATVVAAKPDVTARAAALRVDEPASTEPASTEPASTEPASTEPASTEPASTEPASTEPAAPHEPEKASERSHRVAAARPAPVTAASTNVATDPNDELALLQRAERAVRADNAALALALIGELEARYPHSTLLEERSAIELLAHCRAGASDAKARATRFLRQHPRSLYAGRVRELCPSEDADRSAGALTNPAGSAHPSEQKEP